MFKFKMSLLLKSAKFKVVMVAILIAAIATGIIFMPKNKAGNVSQQVTVKANKTGITVGGQQVYSIVKEGKATGYDKLYCIESGEDLSYSTFSSPIELSKAGNYFSDYNKAMWIINNMYITTITGQNGLDNETAKQVAIMNLANIATTDSVKQKVKAKTGVDYSGVTVQKIYNLRNKTIGKTATVNAIETIEQFALWKYTKNLNTKALDAYEKNPSQYLDGASLSNDEQITLKYLFYALGVLADNNASTSANTVSLNKSGANFDENNHQVGPYYLESNGTKLTSYSFGDLGNASYPIEMTITKSDDTTVNAGAEIITKNADGSFYINLNSYQDAKKVNLKINYVLNNVSTTGYVLDGGTKQNILSVEKTVGVTSATDEKEIKVKTPTGTFTVELKKVKEDGTTVITSSEAEFKINGKTRNTTNGILNIAQSKNIEKVEQVDNYEIVETKAPDGFREFDGTLKLSVGFKLEGNKFIIDESKVKSEGFKDKTRVEVSQDKTKITVFVVNTQKEFDLSLRKFISKINGNKVEPSREPVINENSIKMLEKTGTASYYHTKKSIVVNVGDEVEYTIRVYNEGEILGYAKQVTDYLPEGLSFVKLSEDTAKEYTTDSKAGSKIVVINYSGNTVIKTLRDFIGKKVNVTNEYYQEMKMICKVENTEKVYITNRAEITNYGYESKNKNGEIVWNEAKAIKNVDRDSVQNTIKDELNLDTWYENAKESRYIGEETKQEVVDKNYYPGTQDDDDFETVEVLTGKYNVIIKKVDAEDKSKTLAGAYFTISQTSEKALPVKKGPTDSNGEVTLISGKQIKTDKQVDDYNIYEVEAPEGYNKYNDQIKLTVHTKMEGKNFVIDSQNTKVDGKNVELQVNENKNTIIITVPNNRKEFDLSLRKFITQINDKEITSRIPKVDTSKLATGESKTATYNHPKDPLDVNPSDIVTYTIRVYNEGEVSGYATKIMDDIPEGLEFVPGTCDKEGKATNTNAKYGWKIYKKVTQPIEAFIKENVITYNNEKYIVTDDVKEADLIVTDYLSKENGENNLIKAFDPKTMKELDYRDVKVSFKVVEAKTSDRILINYAQITEHEDSNGDKIKDRDSTPNEWIETDDDQDIEKIKLRYFDLSLLKWVTKAIVYENGQKTVTETGHTGYENPEPVVKVDLKNTSLNNVEVKFEYKIRITNEGDIAGYAKEISDYIPQGLKFVASDNPQWRETDGKIVTRALENTLLQPGETADVTVILTWINGADNLGLKTNIAEISEDYNDYGTPDIDSTPNNKVPDEDDIDDAPVMLSIRTGSSNIIYASIVAGVLAIISLGVIVIKKNILK